MMGSSEADISAERQAPQMDSETWNQHIERNVEVFKEFLVDNLNVSHLLLLLQIEEVTEITCHLHRLQDTGKSAEAARQLLDAINRSDQPGKWTMLVQALHEISGDDSVILHHILGGDCTDPWLDNAENRKLIDLFKEPLHEKLRMKHLLPLMYDKNLIPKEDMKRLKSLLDHEETVKAQVSLIVAMQRHSKTWFKTFLTILYEDDLHRDLAERISPDFCMKKKQEKAGARSQSGGQALVDDMDYEEFTYDNGEKQHPSLEVCNNVAEDCVPVTGDVTRSDTVMTSRDSNCDESHGIVGLPPGEGKRGCCGGCKILRSDVAVLQSDLLQLQTTLTSQLAEIKALLLEKRA